MVEERLDQLCAIVKWPCLFPEAEVFRLDGHFSYHLPILLKLQKKACERNQSARHFKFKNMWIYDENCGHTVQEAWEAVTHPNAWTNLEGKSLMLLKHCLTRTSWSLIM